jgi:acyl transferase domain-containing protein/pimeloyl-ACP methyl ester carboxylesterase/acyl carrier protein
MNDTGQRLARLPAVKLALLAQELRAQTELLAADPIAIIGMSCRFPGGANNLEEYWRLLENGTDAVGPVPKSRWNADVYYDPDPDAPNKTYNRDGGFLDIPVDQFDAGFFGITPREAQYLDPQQRLLLEVGWEAIEHAGTFPASLIGTNTGVFVGISTVDYLKQSAECSTIDGYSGTGNAHSAAAGRLSYTLGLQGPCVAMDTACSSSLVALHLACMSLRNRECDAALAGGVNLMLSPLTTVLFSKLRMLSPSGRCRTFDAAADGYVRGEGCGMVFLKRLSDAIADEDRLLAVLRGTAVNQDGRSVALTVPNGRAQQQVIRRALAFVSPDDIDYVEAHGTGTSLGDPIEIHALKAVFASGRKKPLYIGSVKSNIGHLEAAAGIAGIIKVVLALQKQRIPPHLHLRALNPHIALDGAPIVIPTSTVPWPKCAQRRCAGVSSFGFTGTNAHAVLEEAPAIDRRKPDFHRPRHLLAISASNADSLARLQALYLAELEKCAASALPDLCFTANAGRAQFPFRLTAVGADPVHMTERLRRAQPAAAFAVTATPPVVFLFSGLGLQHVHMAEQLYTTQPVVREILELCDAALRPILQVPLLEVMHRSGHAALLDQPEYAQPALFAIQWALWRMWRDWGVRPAAVMGHDVGEFAAACAAGVMEWESGLRLIARRGALMQSSPEGEMWVDTWGAETDRVRYSTPRIEWISSLTGAPVQESIDGSYWRRDLREPVPFAVGLQALSRAGHCIWLEVGPGSTVLGLVRAQEFDYPEGKSRYLATLEPGTDEWTRVLSTLGQLWEAGVEIDWKAYDLPYGRAKVAAPTYPFHRQRHWVSTEAISQPHEVAGSPPRQRIGWATPENVSSQSGTSSQPYLAPSFSGELRVLDPVERELRLTQYLRGKLAAALGKPEAAVLDGGRLLDLGVDSLTTVGILSDIRREMGIILYPRDFSERPTLAAIAKYMASLVSEKLEAPETAAETPEASFIQQQPRSENVASLTVTDARPIEPAVFESPQERFFDIRGRRLCVCEWGREGDPAVICVHGLLDQGGVWAPVATALARSGFHVFAPDLEGHGRSDHAGTSLSNQLVELLADLEQLSRKCDNQPFTLVGHSMGAALAAIFAALWPECINALVLLELPSGLVELPPSNANADAADLLMRQVHMLVSPPSHPFLADLNQATDRLRQAFPFLPLELASMLAQRITEPSNGGLRWTWDPLLKIRSGLELSRGRYREILRRIAMPVTLIYGGTSDFVGREGREMHEAVLPFARKVTLPCAHHLPLEDPRAVSELILVAAASAACPAVANSHP